MEATAPEDTAVGAIVPWVDTLEEGGVTTEATAQEDTVGDKEIAMEHPAPE